MWAKEWYQGRTLHQGLGQVREEPGVKLTLILSWPLPWQALYLSCGYDGTTLTKAGDCEDLWQIAPSKAAERHNDIKSDRHDLQSLHHRLPAVSLYNAPNLSKSPLFPCVMEFFGLIFSLHFTGIMAPRVFRDNVHSEWSAPKPCQFWNILSTTLGVIMPAAWSDFEN